jgi:hypothetical protein
MKSKNKNPKFIYVTIEEFIDNGGKLKEGRDIYAGEKGEVTRFFGKFLGIDKKMNVPLCTNNTYKSIPVPWIFFVKIEVKPIYK